MTKQKAQKAQAVILRATLYEGCFAEPEGSMHRSFGEFTPFLVSLVEKETSHTHNSQGRHPYEEPSDLSHNGLLVPFADPSFVDPSVSKEAGPSNHKNKTQDQIHLPQSQIHHSLLLKTFHYNGGEHKKQGENDSAHQVDPNKGFFSQGAGNENGKRHLTAIVKEFSQVFVRARFHTSDTLSNHIGDVKMKIHENIDKKSLRAQGLQKNEKGETVSWRGDWNGKQMEGVLSYRPEGRLLRIFHL